MTAEAKTCAKYAKPMVLGFTIDGRGGIYSQTRWVEGEKKSGLLEKIKAFDRDEFLIRAYRCSNCGYIELYAAQECS